MRLTCFLLLSFVLFACNKKTDSDDQGPEEGSYTGVYVESILRKDTINFTKGRAEYHPDELDRPLARVAGYFYLGQKLETVPAGMELFASRRYAYTKDGNMLHFPTYDGPSRAKFRWISYNRLFFIEKFFDRPGLGTSLLFEKVE